MEPFDVSEDIVPLGEFKTHASALLRRIRETGRSVVATQSGRPAVVVVAAAEYERLAERERFVLAVQQGLDAAEAGRVLKHEDVMAAVGRELSGAVVPQPKRRKGRRG